MTRETTQQLPIQIKQLKRRLYFAYLIAIAAMLIQLGSFMWPPSQANNEIFDSSNKIIKTRGIIIVDDQGRERILLGAPIPAAKNRVRTDLVKVEEVWGKRFPASAQYMKWYKDYNHTVNGMLVLDQNGFDRLAIGDNVPDPNIGKRIGTQTGFIFNDEQGFERGGLGLIKAEDKYRVVLGMDSNRGTEGLTLSLFDNGPVGFRMINGKDSIYMGYLPPKTFDNNAAEPFQGILLKQDKETKYQINALQKK